MCENGLDLATCGPIQPNNLTHHMHKRNINVDKKDMCMERVFK